MIDLAYRDHVNAALADLESKDNVRVLLAVESGSRAWGFASSDSDYDVRFIFLRPLADYLSVVPHRDTIERPIDRELDLDGWDLRKMLGLVVRSNAAALEWLGSPIVYGGDPAVAAALRELAGLAAHAPALAYHYDRSARRAWSSGQDHIRLKSYFYALRPALALLWLRCNGTAPPMDLPALLAGVVPPRTVMESIEALRRSKAATAEAATVPRQPVLENFLTEVLAQPELRPATWDIGHATLAANALFKELALAR